MPKRASIGDNSPSCARVMHLAVHRGDTITVANASTSSTISYFTNLTSTPAGTIAPGASQSFTTPTWLTSAGRSAFDISGGVYGQ